MYFLVENIWILLAYFLAAILPKGCFCAWNHHHQHRSTFYSVFLNRLIELSYALHTGVTTNLWLLHHVLGHHHNYLDQTLDESRWKKEDGTKMSVLEYTWSVSSTSYYRGYQVGKSYPDLYRTHLAYTLLTVAIVVGLTVYLPAQALFVFILPMVVGLLITAWATYDHHAGLESQDDFLASYNNMNPIFNFLCGNLGYHTAHHYKQGVHWSELPQLHEEIKDKIPKALFRRSLWDMWTLNPVFRFITRLFSIPT